MSIWFRSTLLVVAMLLTAGVARANCTLLNANLDSSSQGAGTTTFNYTFTYNCGGDIYVVKVSETWDNTGPIGWQQTVTVPGGGSTTTWGFGTAPVFRSTEGFDPRRWLAEGDPEY